MANSKSLSAYSFTEEDINLITFALRRLSDETMFPTIRTDAQDLIAYTERQANEKKLETHAE